MPARPTSHTATERRIIRALQPGPIPSAITAALERVAKASTATVLIGGSTAKGTNLRGDHDIDVFLRYPARVQDPSAHAQKELRRVFKKLETIHGSRDYYQATIGTYTLEFIPVTFIRTWHDAQNVTDMSPLHVTYVHAHLSSRPFLANDVRLFKQFAKAQRVYGAETHIGGISGYVAELLTIHYGGFVRLLAAIATWGDTTTLDPAHHHRSPRATLSESKTNTPLVLVDPVQPGRNAAAALARPTYDRLRAAAANYLRARTTRAAAAFFRITRLTRAAIAREFPKAKLLTVKLRAPAGRSDIRAAKCHAAIEDLAGALAAHGFPPVGVRWTYADGVATAFFAINTTRLPAIEERAGPPLARSRDVAAFMRSHADTFVRNDRIWAYERRAHTTAAAALAAALRAPHIRARVRVRR